MKYVLLIFGIVLVVGGGLSIYSGYDIIEVERGWASVLAGTTAASAGVITIGLALILRSLDRLHPALEKGAERPARRGAKAEAVEPFVAIPDLPIASATLPIDEGAVAQERGEPGIASFGGVAADVTGRVEADRKIGGHEFEPSVPAAEVSASAMADRWEPKVQNVSRAASAFATAAAKARVEPSPSINELWRRVAKDIDAAEPGRTATQAADSSARKTAPKREAASGAAEGTTAEPDDWLDKTWGGVDAASDSEPDLHETAHEAPPLADSVADLTSQPQPDIVGRYEAEGTAYVMFADGSIEAQSEQGIVRFKSMAELKAFFQSQG